jgi:CubicO group peptidase (beta-lactamase class C family)
MIRRLEHAELDDVMQRRIFKPLAMHDADCLGGASPRLSTPYHRAPTAEIAELMRRAGLAVHEESTVDGVNIRGVNVERRNKPTLATGGVQATMLDMQRYASALLRGGDGIVRPDTFAEMIGPQWRPDERLPGWGLGFYRSRDWGAPSFAHGGSTGNGWLTDLVVVPEYDAALLILQNVNGGDFAQGFSRIARAVFGQQDPTPTDAPIDWAILASAPGVYEATGGPLLSFRIAASVGRVQLKRQGDELWLYSRRGSAKSGVRLVPVDRTDPAFLVTQEPGEPRRFLLTQDAAGRVQGIGFADQSLAHLVRTEQVAPWA